MQQILTAPQLLIGPREQQFAPGALLIEDDTIAAVGTVPEIEYRVSSTARRRDYPNGTILPGLINCHVHLAFDGSSDPAGTLKSTEDPDLINDMGRRARQHLKSGVTTVRDLGDRRGLITELRHAIEHGAVAGPRILAACSPLTPPGGHCWFLGGEVATDTDIRDQVRHNAEHGADLIKVMGTGGQMTPDGPGMRDTQFSPVQLHLIVDTARAAGLPTAIHAYTADTIAAAVEARFSTIEHCTFLGQNGAPDLRDTVAENMATSGIAASPALPTGWRQMWDMLGEQRAESIAHRLRWLANHGVPLLFGSDAGVPISQHGDPVSTLELYEHIGFSNAAILELATTTSAHHIGLGDTTGTLRPGLAADILVTNGNPLHDLQALRDLQSTIRAGKDVPT
ncbi:amidohydrolase family protein [Saccharopolyspora sp. SCSIO 74807]|uniref:amidohydrolase family protein n=1 Tax=Saccharopolyspora sp. SCSIO 74807 TaxID=3118084 RepID=UPI0030CDDCE9